MRHDNLIFILQKSYPNAVHGRDFWAAHPIDIETGEQSGEAFIAAWAMSIPQPSESDIADLWATHGAEARTAELAENMRRKRNVLVDEVDILIYKAADSGNEPYKAALGAYRQALRDVPQQAGFPHTINWPVLPA